MTEGNSQTKIPLIFVKKKESFNGALLSLLNLITSQSSSLTNFLHIWYNSAHNQKLVKFIKTVEKKKKNGIIEQAENTLLNEIKEHFFKISIKLLSSSLNLTHHQYKEIRNNFLI